MSIYIMGYSRCDEMELAFGQWVQHKPERWYLYEKLCSDLWNRGWTRYTARGAFYSIVWHWNIEKGPDDPFKMNVNHSPYMARAYTALYPHRGYKNRDGDWEPFLEM